MCREGEGPLAEPHGKADEKRPGSGTGSPAGEIPGRLEEGRDYTTDREGRIVMTAYYHRKRGYCCGNGCLNCPY